MKKLDKSLPFLWWRGPRGSHGTVELEAFMVYRLFVEFLYRVLDMLATSEHTVIQQHVGFGLTSTVADMCLLTWGGCNAL